MYSRFYNGPIRRGDIVVVELGTKENSCEQRGKRPCLVVNTGFRSPVATVIPMTSNINKKPLWFHIRLEVSDVVGSLNGPSILLPEQITTVDKTKIKRRLGSVSKFSGFMERLDQILIRLMCSEYGA